MDFSIDPDFQQFLDDAKAFVDKELIPLEKDFLSQPVEHTLAKVKEKRQLIKDRGWWAPGHPKELGGGGLSLVELGLLSEVLGRTPIGHHTFGCQAPDAGNIELLHKYGTVEQHEKFLLPLVAGDIHSCFAMTEKATAGSNPTLLAATAEKDGDDYLINGHKWFTTSADGSAFTIAMVVTNPDAPSPYLKASMILVPMDNPGVNILRNIPVMGHTGGGPFSHSEVLFDNCRVPQTNLLGPEGQGFILAQDRLGPGRIHHCMRWLGICQRSLDEMCSYVNQRKISANRTLGDMQTIQSWIAESKAEIQAARALVLEAAWKVENESFKAARDHISMIKYFVAGILQKVVDRALQSHGALGMTDDTILAFYYREERAARIYDGPDEVHKMSLAKRILATY